MLRASGVQVCLLERLLLTVRGNPICVNVKPIRFAANLALRSNLCERGYKQGVKCSACKGNVISSVIPVCIVCTVAGHPSPVEETPDVWTICL